ncbi:MAG: GatB/YqeY domain-containing protein [Rubrobacteraceae bacterium]
MSLVEQIQQDTKEAMKSRDRTRVAALRMLSAALKNAELETGEPLDEKEQQAVLRRQLKQREESSESFRKAGRIEQADNESSEAEIVREYLPAPLTREELGRIVDQAVEETGAQDMNDMGAAMGRALALAGDRAEGRELSALVRTRLQQ